MVGWVQVAGTPVETRVPVMVVVVVVVVVAVVVAVGHRRCQQVGCKLPVRGRWQAQCSPLACCGGRVYAALARQAANRGIQARTVTAVVVVLLPTTVALVPRGVVFVSTCMPLPTVMVPVPAAAVAVVVVVVVAAVVAAAVAVVAVVVAAVAVAAVVVAVAEAVPRSTPGLRWRSTPWKASTAAAPTATPCATWPRVPCT